MMSERNRIQPYAPMFSFGNGRIETAKNIKEGDCFYLYDGYDPCPIAIAFALSSGDGADAAVWREVTYKPEEGSLPKITVAHVNDFYLQQNYCLVTRIPRITAMKCIANLIIRIIDIRSLVLGIRKEDYSIVPVPAPILKAISDSEELGYLQYQIDGLLNELNTIEENFLTTDQSERTNNGRNESRSSKN